MRLTTIRFAILFFSISLFGSSARESLFPAFSVNNKDRKMVRLSLQNFAKDMEQLSIAGIDIAGVNLDAKTVDVIVTAEDIFALEQLLHFKIANSKILSLPTAVDPEYTNPEELSAKLAAYAQQYPQLIHVESIGKSLENRNIWGVRLTSDSSDIHKPVVFFNAMHHSREVMTTEVGLDIIDYLASHYGQEDRVTKWLDQVEVWVLPMVNPDGNNKVWHGATMWRKNTRGTNGVDINRNYPYRWGQCNGSGSNESADDYHGPSGGSEPETQVMMQLVARIRPVFSISFHSYSELVLYPHGCRGARAINRSLVEGLGQQMARLLPSDGGSGFYKPGTPWELLYPVDGGDIDWMHAMFQVIPYVIELNSDSQGFQPSYSGWRNKTVAKARPAWMLLLDRALAGGVRGSVTKDGAARPGVKIKISSREHPELTGITYTTDTDGDYQVVLQPGNYTLQFRDAATGASQSRDVNVGADLLVSDVEF